MVDLVELERILPKADDLGDRGKSILIIEDLNQRRVYDLVKEQIRDKFDFVAYCKDNQITVFKGTVNGFLLAYGRNMSTYFTIPRTHIIKMDKIPLLYTKNP